MTKTGRKPGAQLGHAVSEETREKLRKAITGTKTRPCPPDVREKISAAQKGKPRPERLGHPVSEETRRKISEAHKGHHRNIGHRHTPEARRKMSEAAKARGASHNFFVDGNGDARRKERKASQVQLEVRLWREAVFVRDDYTCQMCGVRGSVKLNADHIKPWKDFPELRFDVSNGRTLCLTCHHKTPTFGSKVNHLK